MHNEHITIDHRWRKKLYLQLCFFILLATVAFISTNTAYAEVCEKPVCKRGETYKDGYCHGQSGFPTFAKSHYRARCASGWRLDSRRGTCVKTRCSGCQEKTACPRGFRFDSGRKSCVSGPNFWGHMSHTPMRCDAGWELIRARGICKKCPPRLIRPIPIGPIKPILRLRPDLVIRSFGLKTWGRCKVGYPIATFQVTVANIGTVASPSIGRRPLVHVYDQHGAGVNYGVSLGSIAPGGSRTVMVSLPYRSATAAHIKGRAPHPMRAAVDNIRAIPELNETNNRSTNVINMGLPKGCK